LETDPSTYSEQDKTAEYDIPFAFALKATNDPDTLYLHEALKAPDADKFRQAMVLEVNQHTDKQHWIPVLKKDLPTDTIVLPAIWAMRRKRRIDTRETYKWKSCLNLGGHKMKPGIHFDQTYSPVVTWQTIRLFLIIATLNKWKTIQIDFVMAYTQANINKTAYMELPPGIDFKGMSKETHCLKIIRNLYGGKESGRTWFQHLKNILTATLGYTQSKCDECVFYKGNSVFFVYTDDGIMMDPRPEIAVARIQELQGSFDIEIHGNLQEYLGIQINQDANGCITMTQPHLIDSILHDLGLSDKDGRARSNTTIKDLPSMVSRKITSDTNGKPFNFPWNYRSIIGKLNYLEKSTRPDITYVVHQLARYSTKMRQSHGHAIKHLGRYLLGTKHQGIILQPENPIDLVTYVDADFSGTWDPKYAADDPDTARSRSGYLVFLANAPLYWSSKLQTNS
jgi:Reverse transcriptase (RNA-dependent DNA polymerase)